MMPAAAQCAALDVDSAHATATAAHRPPRATRGRARALIHRGRHGALKSVPVERPLGANAPGEARLCKRGDDGDVKREKQNKEPAAAAATLLGQLARADAAASGREATRRRVDAGRRPQPAG